MLCFCTATRADVSKAQLSAEVVSAVQSTLLANGGSATLDLIARSQAYANDAGQTVMLIPQQQIDDRLASWVVTSFQAPIKHRASVLLGGKQAADDLYKTLIAQANLRMPTLTAAKGKDLLALRDKVLPELEPYFAAAEKEIYHALASRKQIKILCGIESMTGWYGGPTAKAIGLLEPSELPTFGGPVIDATKDPVTSEFLVAALAYQIHQDVQDEYATEYDVAFGSMLLRGYDDGDPLQMGSLKNYAQCQAQASTIIGTTFDTSGTTAAVDINSIDSISLMLCQIRFPCWQFQNVAPQPDELQASIVVANDPSIWAKALLEAGHYSTANN